MPYFAPRSRPSSTLIFCAGVSAFASIGCGTWEPDHQARERAASALDCTEVSVVKIGELRYRAEGCGGVVEVLCTAGHNEPVCLVGRARETGRVSGIADLGAGAETPPEPDARGEDEGPIPRAPGGTSEPSSHDDEVARIETRIRGGLDAHRDDIIACTNRSASVIRVRYAIDGAIALTLGGDLEGSPEEGCVRAAIGGVRVEPGHEGTVMHLVRRGASPQ